jgi:hypothetical protein
LALCCRNRENKHPCVRNGREIYYRDIISGSSVGDNDLLLTALLQHIAAWESSFKSEIRLDRKGYHGTDLETNFRNAVTESYINISAYWFGGEMDAFSRTELSDYLEKDLGCERDRIGEWRRRNETSERGTPCSEDCHGIGSCGSGIMSTTIQVDYAFQLDQ